MNQKPTTVQWIVLAAVSIVLIGLIIANIGMFQTNYYGEQYQDFNRGLADTQQMVRLPGDYKYVVDLGTKQYWPYESRYVQRIPRKDRVYVLDDETMEKFKGYEPGPL